MYIFKNINIFKLKQIFSINSNKGDDMETYEINLILEELLKDDKNRKIHITRNNRKFYNGTIKNIGDETLDIKDDILGLIPIPNKSIIDIQPSISKKER
jgi:hypothetical protein